MPAELRPSPRHLRIQLQPWVKEGAAEPLAVAGVHRGFAQGGLPAVGHGAEDPRGDRVGFRRLEQKPSRRGQDRPAVGQVAAGLGLHGCGREVVGGAELPAAGTGQQRMVAGMVVDV